MILSIPETYDIAARHWADLYPSTCRLNNIFYMFSTLICVFTLDRIGRRWTLYWVSVGQGIAMFLGGGLIRGGLAATASGSAGASSWGAAAASMVFIYTFVFGATWLTVPLLYPAEVRMSLYCVTEEPR